MCVVCGWVCACVGKGGACVRGTWNALLLEVGLLYFTLPVDVCCRMGPGGEGGGEGGVVGTFLESSPSCQWHWHSLVLAKKP